MSPSRGQTPHLDKLANAGVIFTSAYAPTADRDYNHRAILTGLLPKTYRNEIDSLMADQLSRQSFVNEKNLYTWKRKFLHQAIGSVETLPKVLASHGYVSHYLGNGMAFDVKAAGFHHNYLKENYNFNTTGDAFSRQKQTFLDQIAGNSQPVFSYFSLPSMSHSETAAFKENYPNDTLSDLKYFAHLEWSDQVFGAFIQSFKQTRGDKDLIIIYVQDGGGDIFDNKNTDIGYRSPIVFYKKNDVAFRSDAIAHFCDILPTTLAMMNIMASSKVDGLDLTKIISGSKPLVRISVLGETLDGHYIRNDNFFFTCSIDKKNKAIFELNYDPYCTDNMIQYHPAKTKRYLKEIAAFSKH